MNFKSGIDTAFKAMNFVWEHKKTFLSFVPVTLLFYWLPLMVRFIVAPKPLSFQKITAIFAPKDILQLTTNLALQFCLSIIAFLIACYVIDLLKGSTNSWLAIFKKKIVPISIWSLFFALLGILGHVIHPFINFALSTIIGFVAWYIIPIVVSENLNVMDTIKRSFILTIKSFWVVLAASIIIGFIGGILIGLPFGVIIPFLPKMSASASLPLLTVILFLIAFIMAFFRAALVVVSIFLYQEVKNKA